MLRTLWLILLIAWTLLCVASLAFGFFPLGEALGGAATVAPETTLQVMSLPAFVLSFAVHLVAWSAGATPLALFLLICSLPGRRSADPRPAAVHRPAATRQEPTL
ncbi:hypothetical protein SAMN06265365_12811 [Tistlia consotensis]|uniref:Uncharacterized protein n=1 Tax=Tistlia consotensis USBA 355 TaxID=560819 RepID=A0A1Y6CQU9_9PROT|nr:hypothetical protein [Tistlia consotensis]SMF71876.1 hypothetical protein SAMN05428998_13071 [Tistlia consotensis USBA 355]SNS06059.1 hypothetical protein SAMN06265365_12811 [Tistlia consotensis]